MPSRRNLLRAVAVLAILAIAWLASGIAAARVLTARREAPYPEPAPPGFEDVRLRASDGLAIGGWLRRAAAPRAGIVLVHGNGSSRRALVEEAIALSAAGIDAMPISVRAHGDSEGDRNDIGWSARRDVIAAVDRLHEIEGDRPVLVLGVSLGAAASIFAAAELGDRADGHVWIGPYSDLELAVRRRTERYLPPGLDALAYGALLVGGRMVLPDLDRIAPARAARAITGSAPALIVAGGDDDRAPESDARAIAAPLRGARVIVVPGAGHEAITRWAGEDGAPVVRAFADEVITATRDRAASRGPCRSGSGCR